MSGGLRSVRDLAGGAFDVPLLKRASPGLVTMKANAAAALVAVGLALLLPGGRGSVVSENVFALATFLIGVARVV